MNIYYDTGILLKLYTPEPESSRVQRFVEAAGQTLPLLGLHYSECASALHLKVFRGECEISQANRALNDIEDDIRAGVLHRIEPDWESIWRETFALTQSRTSVTGCRTLDTLHVAAARILGFRQFATSDQRQAQLAHALGLTVHNPTQP